MTELVHYGVNRGIATITLDSPHNRNALSRQLVAELSERLDEAAADQAVCAAVLAATGPAFCSGADLSERSANAVPDGLPPSVGNVGNVMAQLLSIDLPVVARVHGPVRAGGAGIVAACDIVVVARSVTFAMPEVQLALLPALISVPLSRVVERRALIRYALTGAPFDADEAARIGLVSMVADDLDATMSDVLAGLRKGHTGALRGTKELFRQVDGLDTTAAFELTGELSAHWFASADAQEGIAAALEKRAPTWRTE